MKIEGLTPSPSSEIAKGVICIFGSSGGIRFTLQFSIICINISIRTVLYQSVLIVVSPAYSCTIGIGIACAVAVGVIDIVSDA